MSTATPGRLEPVLVATKLHAPPLRPGVVPRRELVARLVAERERKLTLVCAPAGWGKSTLLGEWCASPEEHASVRLVVRSTRPTATRSASGAT